MEKNDGGAAFPVLEKFEKYDDERGQYVEHYAPCGGMSLRDYFAAQAMSGIAREPGDGCDGYIKQRARVAYAIADALLKERAK